MSNKITEETLKIMQLIEDNSSISQREISKTLGLSLGKTNYCISSLVDVGYLKIKNFTNSNNKMNYLYLLTPKGIKVKSKAAKNFVQKKKEEYDILVSILNKTNIKK